MTQQHSITPPPELVQEWKRTAPHPSNEHEHYHYITLCAAQWGADTELEACCEWLDYNCPSVGVHHLRTARRPKPLSLKKQAIAVLEDAEMDAAHYNILLRALEQLPDPS